mmetsp:Transcript_1346/g.2074  ORF Transcript_1346/g.2074 Transcript_1346/m.2074 type:complete len:258 (-) Transcript_1346:43-816(-)
MRATSKEIFCMGSVMERVSIVSEISFLKVNSNGARWRARASALNRMDQSTWAPGKKDVSTALVSTATRRAPSSTLASGDVASVTATASRSTRIAMCTKENGKMASTMAEARTTTPMRTNSLVCGHTESRRGMARCFSRMALIPGVSTAMGGWTGCRILTYSLGSTPALCDERTFLKGARRAAQPLLGRPGLNEWLTKLRSPAHEMTDEHSAFMLRQLEVLGFSMDFRSPPRGPGATLRGGPCACRYSVSEPSGRARQ